MKPGEKAVFTPIVDESAGLGRALGDNTAVKFRLAEVIRLRREMAIPHPSGAALPHVFYAALMHEPPLAKAQGGGK